MGKPCVSFEIDGAPEVVVPGETGYLVAPGDSAGLAAATCKLLAEPELCERMGAAGRRLVDPAFRAETMVQEIAAIYEMLMQRHSLRLAHFNRLPLREAS
jgi:glycosyltransferase involved in cell wall biosynthesis